jgi:hypothetical protein
LKEDKEHWLPWLTTGKFRAQKQLREERKTKNERVEEEREEKGRGGIIATMKDEKERKDERVERESYRERM